MDMADDEALIRFRLDANSGVPAYRQIVDQVRHAVSLGRLRPGDQLPPVREVVTHITVNPNTVHRAYRDLEAEGLVRGEQGRGTFVLAGATAATTPKHREELQRELTKWLDRARDVGMDDAGIVALISVTMRDRDLERKEATG
jgi:GntR family transcriptional regulator